MLSAGEGWLVRRFRAMGTDCHLVVGGGDPGLADWARAEVERLEQSWSRFRPSSELNRVHERRGCWVPASVDLLDALVRARALWDRTAGAFDPTVGTSLQALGYDRTFAEVAAGPAGPAPVARPAVGFEHVEVDLDRGRVRVAPGVDLDLGGLGKGLAADLVAEGLVARGAAGVIVGLGGDVRAAGAAPAGGWPVPVLHPLRAAETWRTVDLASEAIVTSTSRLRRWRRGDRELHHIIDPLDGHPAATGVVAVVGRGPAAWWAEGLAKALMVLGEDAAAALLEGTDVTLTAFRADGTVQELGTMEVACSAP